MPTIHDASASQVGQIRQSLLHWYDQNQRCLPWRDIVMKEKDVNVKAYAVWVSEIMLQQTQVATVVEYFNRWLQRWPTVQHLAKADVEEINKLWSGLGYYSRAKRLHEGAQKVCTELGGRVPDSAEALLRLPGVGRYTAGAIASIAFGRPAPVVDGNVVRVLARLDAIGAPSDSKPVLERLWSTAGRLVPPDRPGDFNQALMELGATVCTPRAPSCAACPVRQMCAAHRLAQASPRQDPPRRRRGRAGSTVDDIEECAAGCPLCLPPGLWEGGAGVLNFPRKTRKVAPRVEHTAVCVVHHERRRFLLARRPDTGLLASLWEFPGVVLPSLELSDDEVDAALRTLLPGQLALPPPAPLPPLGDIVHVFSHIRRTYRARAGGVGGDRAGRAAAAGAGRLQRSPLGDA
ncbi:adenine DNA glycosylase-like [Pollicipes pollicipes]|uniref:adenine DNA glycosylase-like n=1 Tax=Pollicipes pollicipes TaxID=41117 RepID=UPI0018852B70|nr:adenine DNA glycosylase-like [Pollicipes pollicipes]XP_037093193.1 adenine DNA glycosylase-like [Pollicipes pollicipes]XP_037093194.1 adenine DNA glycosylase-like [Pollicipes pollicipes]XP_037093196.1 adenine DNA glycosylase-like [Pollicipes pollicipes]